MLPPLALDLPDLSALLPYLAAGAIVLLALGAASLFAKDDGAVEDRLDRLRDPRRAKEKEQQKPAGRAAGVKAAAAKAAPALSKALQPKTEEEEEVEGGK